MMIMDTLIEDIQKKKNPTVVGLDPRLDSIPLHIQLEAIETFGKTKSAAAYAIKKWAFDIIDAIFDLVPAVKPQIAMYEQFGAEGIAAYIDIIAYAKQKGLIVIADIKRGDIASTAEAYSSAYIGRTQMFGESEETFGCHMVTLNPYLGSDSITPFLKDCKTYNKAMFVLVKTSNKGSGDLQDLHSGGKTIYETMGQMVSKWGEDSIGAHGFSAVGAVVGATYPAQAKQLREQMPHTFFLIPGYGAQGGLAEDLAVCFNSNGLGGIVNSSRGIVSAYQSETYKHKFSEKEFAQASRAAVLDMQKDLMRCIPC